MVIEAGRLVEFACPAILLQTEPGMSKGMVEECTDREDICRMS